MKIFYWYCRNLSISYGYYISFCNIIFFFGLSLLCWVCNIPRHDHWVILLFHIQLSLYFGLEMINHCILYIFFNKRTFRKRRAVLFAKTIVLGCRFGFLIYTLNKSTPYPFSRYKYVLLTLSNPRSIVLEYIDIGCCFHSYIVYYY
jgi:uncharacterized membrane protein